MRDKKLDDMAEDRQTDRRRGGKRELKGTARAINRADWGVQKQEGADSREMLSKTIVGAVAGTTLLATLGSLVIVLQLVNEINQIHEQSLNDLNDFKVNTFFQLAIVVAS